MDVQSENEYNVVRSAELPVIANKRSHSPTPPSVMLDPSALWELNQGEHIERDEFRLKRKPKGKAKFIGQSKIEKVRALLRNSGFGKLSDLKVTNFSRGRGRGQRYVLPDLQLDCWMTQGEALFKTPKAYTDCSAKQFTY